MDLFGLIMERVELQILMEATSSQTSTAKATGRIFGATCNILPYSNIDVAGLQRLATLFFIHRTAI